MLTDQEYEDLREEFYTLTNQEWITELDEERMEELYKLIF
jgi:hypothetical protein